jgi:shikimate kinase
MKLFLIGYMGSGKSTVGRKLAAKLGYHFMDTDTIIETIAGKSISEIFETEGEQGFRIMEHELLKEAIKNENIIVSTGGGMPCYHNNMEIMNNAGITVYIKMSPESLARRVIQSKQKRPLLASIANEELPAVIRKKLAEREVYYNQAKYCVKGENFNINNLLNLIKNEG